MYIRLVQKVNLSNKAKNTVSILCFSKKIFQFLSSKNFDFLAFI